MPKKVRYAVVDISEQGSDEKRFRITSEKEVIDVNPVELRMIRRAFPEINAAAQRFFTKDYRQKWGNDSYNALGWSMLSIGAILMIGGLIYDPSVEVVATKMIIFASGGFSAIIGAVLLVAANLLERWRLVRGITPPC